MKHKRYHLSNFNLESYFNKSHTFKQTEDWSLPGELYKAPKWSIDTLQAKKHTLNAVKEQLSGFDLEAWSLHTKRRDPSSSIIKAIRNKYQPELLTQAWCKFYECLSSDNLIPEVNGVLRTLHLCEAPGGFISALNHYLVLRHPNVKLEWNATTLNPDYEGNPLNRMIPDDRLIKFTRDKWYFGADHTGDITKYYNHEYIVSEALKSGKASLITADGSVNCMDDPGDQERSVEHLHYCEVITAFSVLNTGGTFVLKIFTIFEESTICMLYLLNCSFYNVRIFKPITSKSGNSEVYVICKGFKGLDHLAAIWEELLAPYKTGSADNSMFALHELPPGFLQQVHECDDFFMEKQTYTINENVKNFVNKHTHENARVKATHGEITNHFLQRYYLDVIFHKDKVVPYCNVASYNKTFQCNENLPYKYYYTRDVGDIQLKIYTGRKVDKIVYSKYCTQDVVDSNLFRATLKNSLLSITRRYLARSNYTFVISDFNTCSNDDLQRELFTALYTTCDLDKDIVLINIPFLSNFLLGILYILSWTYQHVYFFKKGVIYLKTVNKKRVDKTKQLLNEINVTFNTLSNEHFEPGILEVTGDFNSHFLRCVWFYNNSIKCPH